MSVKVSHLVIDLLLSEASQAHPKEACGILLGDGGRIDQALIARNVHPNPETHFEIDPQALIDAHRTAREGGLQVIGYYHSHPTGDPVPSKVDQAQACGDGRIWAIIAGAGVSLWQDHSDGFTALSYEISDG